MRKGLLVCVMVLLALSVLYWFVPAEPEARQWLSTNNNQYSALAGNRFASTAEALAFVGRLYGAGAVKVTIPRDAIYDDERRIREEGGAYADAIVVTLPTEGSAREVLINIARQEALARGMAFDPTTDISRNNILIWWN